VVVDHVVPWDGDRELFEDEGNWRGLCVGCHNAKTGRERGGGAK
jgi:5-methylcytosine-specific restriction endonuclease McrA